MSSVDYFGFGRGPGGSPVNGLNLLFSVHLYSSEVFALFCNLNKYK